MNSRNLDNLPLRNCLREVLEPQLQSLPFTLKVCYNMACEPAEAARGGLSSTQRCMLKKSGGVPPSKPGLARNAICLRVNTRKQEELHETTSPPQGSTRQWCPGWFDPALRQTPSCCSLGPTKRSKASLLSRERERKNNLGWLECGGAGASGDFLFSYVWYYKIHPDGDQHLPSQTGVGN